MSSKHLSGFRKSLSDNLLYTILKEDSASQHTEIILHSLQNLAEGKPQSNDSYESLEFQGASLLRKWAEAHTNGDEKAAEHYQQKLKKLSDSHPFPWLQTKDLFLKNFIKPEHWKYLDWHNSPKKMDFGVIQHKLPANAKLAIIGDWGTGEQDALCLLDDLLGNVVPDAILHIGDVYFSCSDFEVEQNFIVPLENAFQRIGRRIPVFSIPGNHEYYSGGGAFYRMLEVINAPFGEKYRQEASYFCLRTEDNRWQILGGDTGINDRSSFKQIIKDPGLNPSELEWLKDKFLFSGETIFMTHHPLIDDEHFINQAPETKGNLRYFNDRLLEQIGGLFTKINTWLWGHNHRFAAYRENFSVPENNNLKIPRCRLLGGSSREVNKASEETNIRARFSDVLLKDNNGKNIEPQLTEDLYNHSYAIIDLGKRNIAYYQTPAWTGIKTAPPKLSQNQKRCFFSENI